MLTGGPGSSFYEILKKYKNIQENNIDEENSFKYDIPTALQKTVNEPRTAFMWVDYVVENMEGYGCLVSLYFMGFWSVLKPELGLSDYLLTIVIANTFWEK